MIQPIISFSRKRLNFPPSHFSHFQVPSDEAGGAIKITKTKEPNKQKRKRAADDADRVKLLKERQKTGSEEGEEEVSMVRTCLCVCFLFVCLFVRLFVFCLFFCLFGFLFVCLFVGI